jgi:hypothetical protein
MHTHVVPLSRRSRRILLPLCATLWTTAAVAAEPAGQVKTVNGQVTISRNGGTLPASPGESVYVADRLHSGPNSSVGVTLRDETLLSAGSDSVVDIKQFNFNQSAGSGSMIISVIKGTLALVSGLIAKLSPDSVKVVTPQSTIGIRGTEFVVDVRGGSE